MNFSRFVLLDHSPKFCERLLGLNAFIYMWSLTVTNKAFLAFDLIVDIYYQKTMMKKR